jgi:hypothetical protein
MGNRDDCNYCGNRGKPYSFGCPRCGVYDRSEDDARAEQRSEQARLNAAHRKMLDDRASKKG